MNKKTKEFFISFLRIFVSLFLLYIFFKNTETERLWQTFIKIPIFFWVFSFLSVVVLQIISSFRWQLLGKSLGFNLNWKKYMSFYFVGMFFNLFLPTSIGGDVIKAIYLSREEKGKIRAVYSILADRGLGLGGMFILGATATLIDFNAVPHPFNIITLLSGLITIIGLFLAPILFNFLGSSMPRFQDKIAILSIFWKIPRVIINATVLSVIIQLLANLSVWFVSMGMGLKLSLSYYCIVYPLVSILTLLPISLSGLGVREGGFIYFLGLQGISSENALILSLGSFFVQAIVCLIGGVVFVMGFHKREYMDLTEGIESENIVSKKR